MAKVMMSSLPAELTPEEIEELKAAEKMLSGGAKQHDKI